MPKRIQRLHTKKCRLPSNTKFVGRPSRWGNPYIVGIHGTADQCVQKYEIDIRRGKIATPEEIKRELKGMNLMCWCPLDKPCHADVLLRIANEV